PLSAQDVDDRLVWALTRAVEDAEPREGEGRERVSGGGARGAPYLPRRRRAADPPARDRAAGRGPLPRRRVVAPRLPRPCDRGRGGRRLQAREAGRPAREAAAGRERPAEAALPPLPSQRGCTDRALRVALRPLAQAEIR